MSLRALRNNWDRLARTDPLWAILTHPEKKNNRWDEAEFFRIGVDEIAEAMSYASRLGRPASRRRALDFGCGVGRLTQAIAAHFDEVFGVDIAPAMIDLARGYNTHGSRCTYVLNDSADLRVFPDGHFDLAYSNITLQHMRPPVARRYIRELIRVLAPGGLLVFQVPAPRPMTAVEIPLSLWRFTYWRMLRLLVWNRAIMEMHGIAREQVAETIRSAGGELVDTQPSGAGGPDWPGFRYAVTK